MNTNFKQVQTEDGKTILVFMYENQFEVSFDVTEFGQGNTLINATNMAEPFKSKRIHDFLRLASTEEYINTLSDDMRIPSDQIYIAREGGNRPIEERGTWMHQHLALKFARWLNPYFGIWCNQVIRYLLEIWVSNNNPSIAGQQIGFFGSDKNYVLDENRDLVVETYINRRGVIIPVPFDVTGFNSGEVMINVTDIIKSYPNKNMGNFLRNSTTKEYIKALKDVTGLPLDRICKVTKGGLPGEQGTLMHQNLAIEFTQWLDPHFGIWCNSKVLEVLHKGLTTVYPAEYQRYNNIISGLNNRIQEQDEIIRVNQPKVDYYDRYLNADSCGRLYTTTEAIQELGIQDQYSAKSLHNKLIDLGVAYRTGSGRTVIKSVHSKFGLLKTVTSLVPDGNGGEKVVKHEKWTERGLNFLGMVLG